MSTTTNLKGSEKQVNWAERIRQDKLEAIAKFSEYNPDLTAIDQCVHWLGEIASAKFWIEHRDIPASAFLAYAYRKQNLLVDGRMPVYYQRQSMKQDGVEQLSKLVKLRFGFIGKEGVNSSKLIKAIPNVEIHQMERDGVVDVQLKMNPDGAKNQLITANESETGCDIAITPVRSLLEGGWASKNIEIIVVAIYLQYDRISGSDKAYVFEKIQ